MKATLWKTHYFSLRVSFKQHNDYKWAKIVIYLIIFIYLKSIACALLFVT